MDIIFVTPEFVSEKNTFDGGLSNYIYKVSKKLIERGQNVKVCISSNKDEVLMYEDIEVHRVKVTNKLVTFLDIIFLREISVLLRWTYQSYKLNKYIKTKIKSEAIVQYTSYTCPSLFHRFISGERKVIRYSGYQPDILLEYNNFKKNLYYYQVKFLEDIILNQAIKKFAPSELLVKKLKKIRDVEIKIIRTAFELPKDIELRPIKNEIEGNKYILFFGTVGVLKGALDLTEALPIVMEKFSDLHFVCIGKDTFLDGKSIKSIIQERLAPFKSRVHIFDKMERSELYSYIKNSHRVVLPSRLDNLPNTLLEAMGYSRIVIGTKNSSLDEVIRDGYNGFLCENSNPCSLGETIVKSLNILPEEELCIIENIKETNKNLTMENHIKELVNFYNECDK